MKKEEVKQVIREALAREPAIEWYLKSKKSTAIMYLY